MSIVSLMYAEHVLKVPVDWSTLKSVGFGRLLDMYLARKPSQIPYVAVLDWFRNDPTLLEDPESPANLETWPRKRAMKKRRLSPDNELEFDADLELAFAQLDLMNVDGADRADGADVVAIGLDIVPTGPDGVPTGPDEMRPEFISVEEHRKVLADVEAYKARILFLESKLAELGFREDPLPAENPTKQQALRPTTPVFHPNEADRKGKRQMTDLELWRFEERMNIQGPVEEQVDSALLDSAVDWMNLADQFATALAFENQALVKKMDDLREELQEPREVVTRYEVMEDNIQELERQNRNMMKVPRRAS